MKETLWSLALILCSISMLSAGSYDGFLVESNLQIDSVSQVQETCDLSNGSLTVHVSGSNAGVEYSIDGGVTWQTSNFFPGLPDDDYLVLVRDVFFCSDVFTAQISDALDPEVELEVTCVPGRNLSNIIPTVLNGTPQYQYNWEGMGLTSTSEVFENVPPGFYSVTVTDRLGCTISDTVTVQACCELRVQCSTQQVELDCLGELPAIDSTLIAPETSEADLVIGLQNIGIDLEPDFCQVLKVSVVESQNSPTTSADGRLTVMRTYSISDDFFSYDCNQELSILRPIAPIISNEAENLTAECGSDIDVQFQDWLDNNASLMLDGCTEPYRYSTEPAIPFPPTSCNEAVDITFIVIDDCENEFRSMATFLMEDNGAPTITCPPTLTVDPTDDFLEDTINDWLETVSATDDCASTSPTNDFFPGTLDTDCDQSIELEVNFDVLDACGNADRCVGLIMVRGLTAPALNCGQDLTLDCVEDREASFDAWLEDFSAEDGNGVELDITNDIDLVVLGDLNCGEDLGVLFSIEDDCGRPLDCLRIISLVDTEDPEMTCPQDLEVFSSDTEAIDMINSWIDSFSAQDNCDDNPNVTNDYAPVADLCAVTEDIDVVYTVEDLCGNSATCTTSLSVVNTSASLICPPRLTLECGEGTEEDVLDWLALVEGIDNDGSPIANDFNGLDDFTGCAEPMEVTFSTNSLCGGDADCVGTIEIIDTTAPTIDCPNSLEIDLINSNDVNQAIDNWLAQATGSDCNGVDLSDDFVLDASAQPCGATEIVTFTVVDNCGLTNTCESNLILINEASVAIDCPEPMTLTCTDPRLEQTIDALIESAVVVGDNPFEVTTEMSSETLTQDCVNVTSLSIDLFVVDICGNEDFCTTEIQIQPEPQVYIPNIISPDGDGINDYFNAFGNVSIDYIATMIIYNRWGNKVFHEEDIPINDEQAGWNGRFNNVDQESQVFTYYLEIIDTTGKTITKAGSLQVLK